MTKKAKADRAQELIDDPTLTAAFEEVRGRLIEELVDDHQHDDAYYMELKKCIKMLDIVREKLHQAIRDGKLEAYAESQTPFLQDLHNVH